MLFQVSLPSSYHFPLFFGSFTPCYFLSYRYSSINPSSPSLTLLFPIIVLLVFHQFFSSLSWAHLVPTIVYLTFTLPKTIPLPFSTLSSPHFYCYKFAYSLCTSLSHSVNVYVLPAKRDVLTLQLSSFFWWFFFNYFLPYYFG